MQTKNYLYSALMWLFLLALTAATAAMIIIPVFLIQPFAPQTERDLAISFWLKSWSPILTIAAILLSFGAAIWLWQNSRRRWSRALLVVPLAVVVLCAWAARQNHFEWMFNPLGNSAYAKIAEADFVADDDMVLAIKINNEAVAYPIRQMAYHHLVGDTVGGVPIVATY